MDISRIIADRLRVLYLTYQKTRLRFLMFTCSGIIIDEAKKGVVNAQMLLGAMYSEGIGVVKDNKEAFRWYLMAAERGNHNAQIVVGLQLFLGKGVVQNHIEAIQWFYKSARQNNRNAQLALGLMYANGIGVTKNEYLACSWFTRAFIDGNGDIKNTLLILASDSWVDK